MGRCSCRQRVGVIVAEQLTYHGVLAPASSWRDMIVPRAPAPAVESQCAPIPSAVLPRTTATTAAAPSAPPSPYPASDLPPLPHSPYASRYSWSELMRRVFGIDVLTCERCHGRRRLIALITDTLVARNILRHLGLASEAPPLAAARPPPQMAFDF